MVKTVMIPRLAILPGVPGEEKSPKERPSPPVGVDTSTDTDTQSMQMYQYVRSAHVLFQAVM